MAHIAWGCSVSSLDNIQTHRDWIQPNFCQLLLTFSELSGSLLQWLGEVCKPKGLLGPPTDWPSVQAVKLNQNPTTKKPNNPSLQKKTQTKTTTKRKTCLKRVSSAAVSRASSVYEPPSCSSVTLWPQLQSYVALRCSSPSCCGCQRSKGWTGRLGAPRKQPRALRRAVVAVQVVLRQWGQSEVLGKVLPPL